jgi:hypothetical protein
MSLEKAFNTHFTISQNDDGVDNRNKPILQSIGQQAKMGSGKVIKGGYSMYPPYSRATSPTRLGFIPKLVSFTLNGCASMLGFCLKQKSKMLARRGFAKTEVASFEGGYIEYPPSLPFYHGGGLVFSSSRKLYNFELKVSGLENLIGVFPYFDNCQFVGIKGPSYVLFKELHNKMVAKEHLDPQLFPELVKLSQSINDVYEKAPVKKSAQLSLPKQKKMF